MNIEELLVKIKLPDIHSRANKSCYYDSYRKKLIEVTPEETVRQKVAAMYETVFDVPKEMIWLEVPMSYYVDGAKGRADIIIHALDKETGNLIPIAIVECKKTDVFLTDGVLEQAMRYCDTVGGKYIIATNGKEMEIAVYDEETDSYIFLDKILDYNEMVQDNYEKPELQQEQAFVRFTLDEMKDQKKISEYNAASSWIFGENTNPQLRSFAVNLYQCLMDVEHQLPKCLRKNFEMIEDLGQRFMDYTNAGGGHYNGVYRAFLVKDRFGESQIISLSLFGTDSDFRGENRNSYTSFVVAVDSFKVSHNALQYNVDRFTEIREENICFTHNGQIANLKSADLLDYVRNTSAISLENGKLYLGRLPLKKLLMLNDSEVSEFVYNVIEYALIREEFRRGTRIEKRK